MSRQIFSVLAPAAALLFSSSSAFGNVVDVNVSWELEPCEMARTGLQVEDDCGDPTDLLGDDELTLEDEIRDLLEQAGNQAVDTVIAAPGYSRLTAIERARAVAATLPSALDAVCEADPVASCAPLREGGIGTVSVLAPDHPAGAYRIGVALRGTIIAYLIEMGFGDDKQLPPRPSAP